jgi:hypothetical protein
MKVGSRVNRLEYREVTGATTLEIDGENALIEYDEGGRGWWPVNCLELVEEKTDAPEQD